MRVLIASDDPALVPCHIQAYSTMGWDVATGVTSFYRRADPYDLASESSARLPLETFFQQGEPGDAAERVKTRIVLNNLAG